MADSSGSPTRRDFIHRMSVTLGLVAVYRRIELIERAADRAAPSLVSPSARAMTWWGDAFEDGGELPSIRRLGVDFFERGRETAAFDVMLRGVAAVDAPEPEYRALLEALSRLCLSTRRTRAHATVRWYLRATPTGPLRDARDEARTLAIEGKAERAALRYAEVDFLAHAATSAELALARDAARVHWSGAGDRLASVVGDDLAATSAKVHRALAVHHVARNSSSGLARDRAEGASLRAVEQAIDRFDALGASLHAASARSLRDDIASQATNEGRTVMPLLDADHAHDAAEICASILHDASLERRLTPRAVSFVRRRALLARLLALEIDATPSRAPEVVVEIRAALAMRLGQLGDPRLLVPLETMMLDDAEPVRTAAREARRELVGER